MRLIDRRATTVDMSVQSRRVASKLIEYLSMVISLVLMFSSFSAALTRFWCSGSIREPRYTRVMHVVSS